MSYKPRNLRRFLGASLATSMVATTGLVAVTPTEAATGVLHTVEFADLAPGADFRVIEVGFPDYNPQQVLDVSRITIDGELATVETVTIGSNGKLHVVVNNIDPRENDITLRFAPGSVEFNGYQQVSDIEVTFEPHDVMPEFNNLFRSGNSARANIIFDQNKTSEIMLHVTGSYLKNVDAIARFDGDTAQDNTAEIIVTTEDVDIVTISVNGEVRRVVQSQNNTPDEFRGAVQGVDINDDVTVTAYNSSGMVLESQTVLLRNGGTNFDTNEVLDFTQRQFTILDYLTQDMDLEQLLASQYIRVGYENVPYIRYVGNGLELAEAMAELARWRASAADHEKAVIRLTGDITNITSPLITFNDKNLIIESDTPGTSRTIGGNVKFGNGADMDVLVRDVDFTGTGEVDINTGDSNLSSVTFGSPLIITSAGSTSVYLNNFTAPELIINNSNAVRIVAEEGTVIDKTIINNDGTADTLLIQRDGGLFTNITKTGIAGAGKLVLSGEGNTTQFTSVTMDGTGDTNKIVLGNNVTLDALVANQPTDIEGDPSSIVTTVDATSLGNEELGYVGVQIGNLANLGDKVREIGSTTGPIDLQDPVIPEDRVSLTELDLEVQSNKSGTAYYLVQTKGDPAPDASTVTSTGTNSSVTAGVTHTFNVTGLTRGTEYDIYVVSDDGSDTSEVKQVSVQTKDKVVRLGGSVFTGMTHNDLRQGGKTLTLALNGTIRWAADVTTNAAAITALEQALDGSTTANIFNGKLNGQLSLSSDRKTLTVTLPALLDTEFDPAESYIEVDESEFIAAMFEHTDTLDTSPAIVQTTNGYRDNFALTATANLADITLSTSNGTDPAEMIPTSGTVDFTLGVGGLTQNEFEYNTGGANWFDADFAEDGLSGTVQVGQTVTVREKDNQTNTKSFEIKAGEAWVQNSTDLTNVFTQPNIDDGLRRIHLAGGSAIYDISSVSTVNIPSGEAVTFVGHKDATGEKAVINLNGAQDQSRIKASDDAVFTPVITGVQLFDDSGDHNIDRVVLTFSKDIVADDMVADADRKAIADQFDIGGATIAAAAADKHIINGNQFTIHLDSSALGTGKPQIDYTAAGTAALKDVAGNILEDITIADTSDLILDTLGPVATVATDINNDGGTAQEIENDDKIIITFSESMDEAAMGTSYNVVADNSDPTILRVYKGGTSTNAADLVATITTTGAQYNTDASETMTFNDSSGVWSATDTTLTITLDNLADGTVATSVAAPSDLKVIIGPGARDLSGNTGDGTTEVTANGGGTVTGF